MIYASVKGFGPGPYEDCKVYENVAQCTGGSASHHRDSIDGPPLVTGSQIGDSGTGIHLVAGILAALFQREKSGRGQRVTCAMQDTRAESLPREAARSAAAGARPAQGISAISQRRLSATPCRAPATLPAAAIRAGRSDSRRRARTITST